jgi:hypothetical protein
MNQFLHEHSKDFSTRKVSVDQAVKLLRRKGIRVNKESAEIILDFLYCIAKTYKTQQGHVSLEIEPKE